MQPPPPPFGGAPSAPPGGAPPPMGQQFGQPPPGMMQAPPPMGGPPPGGPPGAPPPMGGMPPPGAPMGAPPPMGGPPVGAPMGMPPPMGGPPGAPPPGAAPPMGGPPPGAPMGAPPPGPPMGAPPPGPPMGAPPPGGAPRAMMPQGVGPPPGPPTGMPPPPGAQQPGMPPPPTGMAQPGMPPPPTGPPQPGQGYGAPGAQPPPPMGAMPPGGGGQFSQPHAPPGGFDQYGAPSFGGAPVNPEQVMGQFAALSMGGTAPGQQTEVGTNPAEFPRPGASPFVPPVGEGQCDSAHMRLTVNALPNTAGLKQQWGLPLGAIVQPLNPEANPVPVVDFGQGGIVRCRKCRTYINPFVQWTDGGRRFRCNICGSLNDVPVDYFCTLDPDGRRRDTHERAELSRGSVEYVASAEYMVRPPMPPVYFFVIDVTSTTVQSGALECICQTIKDCLDRLPGDSRTQVGFLTYDSTLHFYNLSAKLAAPQMMVVADLEGEPFLPIPTEDLVVNLVEARAVIDALLTSLPSIVTNASIDSAFGPAIQAAHLAMSHLGGKMLIFQGSLPSMGVARLRNRDNPALYGTDREHSLRGPEDPFFKKMAAECSKVQICCDLFSFAPQYTDIASLSTLCKYTGGQVYYFPSFGVQRDGVKLREELTHNLTRETGWEAVMRIRCSQGLKISSFHGHFFIRSADLLALPCVDGDKAYAVQIGHEENAIPASTAYLQCALLYTSSGGERRIRVHTMAVPVVADLREMYKAADGAACSALLARLAVEKTLSSRLEDARQAVTTRVVAVLKEYKSLYGTQHRMPNKLVLPETLKLVPLYGLGITKCKALRGGASSGAQACGVDERAFVSYLMMSMGINDTLRYLYPTLYKLDDLPKDCCQPGPDGTVAMPTPVALATEVLDSRGCYLLDDGMVLICWVGRALDADKLQALFGAAAIGDNLSLEPEQDSELSASANKLLGAIRGGRKWYQQCFVVRQGDAMEAHWLPYLIEDRTQGAMSYTDFLCHMHRNTSATMRS